MKSRLTTVPNIGESAIIDWGQLRECSGKCFILTDVALRHEAHHDHPKIQIYPIIGTFMFMLYIRCDAVTLYVFSLLVVEVMHYDKSCHIV